MIKALALYTIAAVLTFLQHNSQLIHEVFKGKQNLLIVTLSIPISFCYVYAWTYFMSLTGNSTWSTRFIFFGLSYLVFPLLAYFLLNESPFTLKTFICTFLSLLIIFIQYKL